VQSSSVIHSVTRRWPLGIPFWIFVGTLSVGALAAVSVWSKDDKWAVIATAVATTFLAIFTAQLYGASVAQFRASMRPVLVEVKPYAPPPSDLGGRRTRRGKVRYNIHFPDKSWRRDWDARRPYVDVGQDGGLRISLVVRNVGEGLAMIDSAVQLVQRQAPKLSGRPHVRYPRLPPGESTRINMVTVPLEGPAPERIQVKVPYTDLSTKTKDSATFTLSRRESEARTAVDGHAWHIERVDYDPDGLTPLG
jgi:hypothetical protein